MDEKEKLTIPYCVHELQVVRHDKTVKRLIIALIIAVLLIFASNVAWLYAWTQYDYSSSESQEIIVDSKDGGNANYIGNSGEIVNGKG